MSSSSIPCQVCEKNFSQYTCPKCMIPYCSLHCYRSEKHNSGECLQNFHQESLKSVLKGEKLNEQEIRETKALLAKLDLNSEDILPQDSPLDTILAKFDGENVLDIPANTLWSRLSKEEQQEFIICVDQLEDEDGSILQEMVELWQPWWEPENRLDRRGSFQSLASTSSRSSRIHPVERSPVPDVLPDLQPLTKPPHPDTVFNMVDVLFSYAFVLRHLNGEMYEDAMVSATLFWATSPTLGKQGHTVHPSVTVAIDSIRQAALKHSQVGEIPSIDFNFTEILIGDVIKICTDWDWIKSALSDVTLLFASLGEAIDASEGKNLKKQAFLTEKKCQWMVNWAETMSLEGGPILQLVRTSLEIELANLRPRETLETSNEIRLV